MIKTNITKCNVRELYTLINKDKQMKDLINYYIDNGVDILDIINDKYRTTPKQIEYFLEHFEFESELI